MFRFRRFGLPLLAKELVELAGQARTYQVRVGYAAILLVASCMVLFSLLPAGGVAPANYLGSGWPVVMWLGYLQRLGLQFVLPVLACGVFTVEKERNTLGLLFLTQLGPWTIIFEKLLSRLLLAFSFLIISAPVLAFAYSLGGITLDDLAAHFLGLLITALRIVTVCLLCSAYCGTTLGALLASYLLNYVLRVATSVGVTVSVTLMSGSWSQVLRLLSSYPLYRLFIDLPPLGLVGRPPTGMTGFGGSVFLRTLAFSVPTLAISGVCVLFARRFLVSRAFATPSRRLRLFFERLDRFFVRANNNSWTRGVVLTRTDNRLPDDAPVAWRETTTRSLGQVRYLVRLLLLVELPVLCLLFFATISAQYDMIQNVASYTLLTLWVVLTLVTCVSAAGLMTRERRQQTLDVLLATPLSGREIVQQKMAGVTRLIWICEVPMWTCLAFYLLGTSRLEVSDVLFVINHTTTLLIYPWMIAWIAMWCGTQSKSAIVAVLKSFGLYLAICVLPILAFGLNLGFQSGTSGDPYPATPAVIGAFLSPLTIYFIGETRSNPLFEFLYPFKYPTPRGIPVAWLINAVIHGTLLYWFKKWCLARADVLLGRLRSGDTGRSMEPLPPISDQDELHPGA